MSVKAERNVLKLFNTFHSRFKCDYKKFVDIVLRAYESNLYGLSSEERLLVKYLINIINELRAWNADTLNEMKNFVEKYRSNYRQTYVVDCLGLPDIYAIWCEACEKGLIGEVKVFINRKATTSALKEAFGAETLTDVAIHTDGIVLRKFDTLLHSEIFREPKSRSEFVNLLVERMKYAASQLLSLAEKNTMILSDHGYDIISHNSMYVAKHTRIPRTKIALARLAPVVLLKQP